jgi:MipA family protein
MLGQAHFPSNIVNHATESFHMTFTTSLFKLRSKKNTRHLLGGFVLATSCALSPALHAQTSQSASTSNWTVNLGAGLVSGPTYPGANDNKTELIPIVEARYKDYLFISPVQGIGVDFPIASGLKASAAIGLDFTSRREKESPRLVGLGAVKSAGALLLGLDYRLGDAFAKASLSSRLGSDKRRGTSLDLDVGYNLVRTQSLLLGAGLNLRTMDNTYARNFFGVNTPQSVASKLQAFNAGGGLQSAGEFATALYRIDNSWSLFSRLNLYQLQGDAADSPIVQKKNQNTFVFGVTRSL